MLRTLALSVQRGNGDPGSTRSFPWHLLRDIIGRIPPACPALTELIFDVVHDDDDDYDAAPPDLADAQQLVWALFLAPCGLPDVRVKGFPASVLSGADFPDVLADASHIHFDTGETLDVARTDYSCVSAEVPGFEPIVGQC
ncbi:hypothetical protein AURDEDRAFT_116064 [Auricularia subglabra TFB-10046 SS5]|uniref:Uncharacterized protein n=1 Tax=Auricularia subglabra (strain TFB-10046 / SS5) TaxID=717982 RepID=J0D1R9_AURST|nr:hypothetical protein AURDEDRAFT_116064 [Auricularia subglabra TFB-10046 SS5]